MPKYHSFWSLSASVHLCYREGSWCCLIDTVICLLTLVLLDLKKFRKWLIAFSCCNLVQAFTCQHYCIFHCILSIPVLLPLIELVIWYDFIYFLERENAYILLSWYHTESGCFFVNPGTVFCLLTVNTLWHFELYSWKSINFQCHTGAFFVINFSSTPWYWMWRFYGFRHFPTVVRILDAGKCTLYQVPLWTLPAWVLQLLGLTSRAAWHCSCSPTSDFLQQSLSSSFPWDFAWLSS